MLCRNFSLKRCCTLVQRSTVLHQISPVSSYVGRHIGLLPAKDESSKMLKTVGFNTMDELLEHTIPSHIRLKDEETERMKAVIGDGLEEHDALNELKEKMDKNKVFKSYIGMGYYDTLTPLPILRNILENPSWYTPYTPYQAEIAQGRLEMLLNFQTMISDIVGKELSNASLLDESTACAEAMTMCLDLTLIEHKKKELANPIFLVSKNCHPQNIEVIKTRAEPIGITVEVVDDEQFKNALSNPDVFAALTQYPDTYGSINENLTELTKLAHENDTKMIVSTDLMACSVLKPPGECNVDIVVGSAQRFGVPLGYGGPHAAFLATDTKFARQIPGRIIGVTKDSRNKRALRLALQTREQHIRRDKATSNICTAQALLANVAASYAVYHGPNGIKNIANRINSYTKLLAFGLTKKLKCVENMNENYFDTITVKINSNLYKSANDIHQYAQKEGVNFRQIDSNHLSISIDETTQISDLTKILKIFEKSMISENYVTNIDAHKLMAQYAEQESIPPAVQRATSFLQHETFNQYHSETSFMRYLYELERKDLGLNTAMIPLGSCTMKLNAASAMQPISWPTVNNIHPFAPLSQIEGYQSLINDMESWLAEVTGFDAVSLQPNSGAQGEYTGLLTIREYHKSNGNLDRDICLIPTSAHGTNPASAAMCNFRIASVKCDPTTGFVDVADFKKKAEEHRDNLAGAMITYPSTHGVFEDEIMTLCDIVHENGGLVYMDGANLQAQLTKTSPGSIGADVCHLNLHKTFCIPHGGGGPGLGPIGVNNKLSPFLPTHPVIDNAPNSPSSIGPIAAAPWSSASILIIPWMYIRMMGYPGLKLATETAILNANYMAKRLENDYKILYRRDGLCAHEFIIDIQHYEKKGAYKIGAEDVAKRLMDYSFHAPTMSWPVTNTLMVEPTESEPLYELDRFCDAMISIRKEIEEVENGNIEITDSPLRNAPHTIDVVISDEWNRKYSRNVAAVNPTKSYWPTAGRVDNVYGDKNPVCSCPPVELLDFERLEKSKKVEKEI